MEIADGIMDTVRQNTVGRAASVMGIGLHAGARAKLTIKPAPADFGIRFARTDLPGQPTVRAIASNVVDVRRGTTIKEGEALVYTVEHIMAAVHAAGIDNALLEMDGPEPPIADGSAKAYWDMVKEAGVKTLDAPAMFWECREPMTVCKGDTSLAVFPCDRLKITCVIAFGATPLDAQYFSGVVTAETFGTELAAARTFVIYRELEQLIGMGLVKGGSLDNAIILHDGAIVSKEGLRFENELARHKALDIVGDIYLTGRRAKAHVIAYKPGHPTNVEMAVKILRSGAGV